jgi:hypothetical protein
MILKFLMKRNKEVGPADQQEGSKSDPIHSQRFHQQAEIVAIVIKWFMGVIGPHGIQK